MNLVVELVSEATPVVTDPEIVLVHQGDVVVLVIVEEVVPVRPVEEKMEIVHVDVSLHCTGMFHRRASNI